MYLHFPPITVFSHAALHAKTENKKGGRKISGLCLEIAFVCTRTCYRIIVRYRWVRGWYFLVPSVKVTSPVAGAVGLRVQLIESREKA